MEPLSSVGSLNPSAKDEAKDLEKFNTWVDELHRGAADPQIRLEPMPAPGRLAPFADAITAELSGPVGEEMASGRMVFLYNPAGVTEWDGNRRCVIFVRSVLESEMANDPLASEVGWSWLTESLEKTDAQVISLSGTVTRTSSESFGTIEERGPMGLIEIRASWTPVNESMASHGGAWATLIRMCAGLPVESGVTHLSTRNRA